MSSMSNVSNIHSGESPLQQSPMSPFHQNMPISVASPLSTALSCKYKSGKCSNYRATKRNGQLHTLCHFHRVRQNEHQRKSDRKHRMFNVARQAKLSSILPDSPDGRDESPTSIPSGYFVPARSPPSIRRNSISFPSDGGSSGFIPFGTNGTHDVNNTAFVGYQNGSMGFETNHPQPRIRRHTSTAVAGSLNKFYSMMHPKFNNDSPPRSNISMNEYSQKVQVNSWDSPRTHSERWGYHGRNASRSESNIQDTMQLPPASSQNSTGRLPPISFLTQQAQQTQHDGSEYSHNPMLKLDTFRAATDSSLRSSIPPSSFFLERQLSQASKMA